MPRGSVKIELKYRNSDFSGDPIVSGIDVEFGGYRQQIPLNEARYKPLSEVKPVVPEREYKSKGNSKGGNGASAPAMVKSEERKESKKVVLPGDDDEEKYFDKIYRTWIRMFNSIITYRHPFG